MRLPARSRCASKAIGQGVWQAARRAGSCSAFEHDPDPHTFEHDPDPHTYTHATATSHPNDRLCPLVAAGSTYTRALVTANTPPIHTMVPHTHCPHGTLAEELLPYSTSSHPLSASHGSSGKPNRGVWEFSEFSPAPCTHPRSPKE